MARFVGVAGLVGVLVVGCGGGQKHDRNASSTIDPHAVRYRLRLRHNAVDPGKAFRCYGRCQSENTPQSYLECLSACPGFEETPGMRCDVTEVPPEAACFTVRKMAADKEIPPGLVVIAVVANIALVVALSSLCTSSPQQCGYNFPAPR